jgi:hypothetical protein
MADSDIDLSKVKPENIQEALSLIKQLKEAVIEGALENSLFELSLEKISEDFSKLTSSLDNYLDSFSKQSLLLDSTKNSMAALVPAIFAVQKSFEGLGGVDSSKLTTYSSQLDELEASFNKGGSAAANAVGGMVDSLLKLGASSSGINKVLSLGSKAFFAYSKSILESADNSVRLRAGYIALAAQAGELDSVYEKAGDDLSNISSLMNEQTSLLVNVEKATGASKKTVAEYYNELGKVPGALRATVDAFDGSKLDMLTATMKFAAGAGLNFANVTGEMHKAFTELNLTGDKSLEFISKFSEISNKFGIEFKSVSENMMEAAKSFQLMTDTGESMSRMTSGLSNIMNEYVGGLKATGMPGEQAVRSVNSFTEGIRNLGMAQKSFLSSQTGGPGGLLGAVKIEKMIREGGIEKVQGMVSDLIKKQFGNIVTQEEAVQSEAAASQFVKQRMMLQQGPLKGLVKSDAEATRWLEVLKSRETGVPVKGESGIPGMLNEKYMQSKIDKGTSLQEKTNGFIKDANDAIADLTLGVQTLNETMIQQIMQTAGKITPTASVKLTKEEQDRKTRMQEAGTRSGVQTSEFAREFKSKDLLTDRSNMFLADTAKTSTQVLKNFPGEFKSVKESIIDMYEQTQGSTLKSEIGASTKFHPTPVTRAIERNIQVSEKKKEDKTKGEVTASGERALQHDVHVKVEGVCIICHQKMTEGSAQARSISQTNGQER